MYSRDITPVRMRTVTAEMAMMASTEGMGVGNVYDKHKDAILSFVGRKGVLVFLFTGKM